MYESKDHEQCYVYIYMYIYSMVFFFGVFFFNEAKNMMAHACGGACWHGLWSRGHRVETRGLQYKCVL